MDFNKKKLKLIKEVLKSNPRGMTVTAIAKEINMNSHSAGRYLEVLAAAGHVDVTVFGRSKVYYQSQRLPVSAMLSLSSDIILILDKDMRIVNANEKFYEFTKAKRDEIINRAIGGISFPLKFTPEITPSALGALNGKESRIEAYFKGEKEGLHFTIKLIPTIFDDGEKGVTIIFEDITERKKIEEERSFLAAIVESTNDAIISMTLDGIITSWNSGAERLYGYGPEEMKGISISKLVMPDRPDEIPGLLDKIRRGERIENYETLRQRKNGSVINVSLTVSPITDASKNIIGVSSIHHDITRHIESVNALKESEKRFRVLADSSLVAIIVYQDDAIVYMNPATLKLSGYAREELMGKSFWSFIHPDHRQFMKDYWLKSIRGEKTPSRYEFKIIEKGGVLKWADCSTADLEYNGRPAILVSLLDISERKRAEEALHKSEEEYRHLVEHAPTAIYEIDYDGLRFKRVNDAMCRILGYTKEEMLAMNPFDLLDEESKVRFQERIKKSAAGEYVDDFVAYHVLTRDGQEKWVDLHTKLIIADNKINGALVVAHDVTERMRMEKALRESEEMFRAISDSSQAAIIVYQVDTIVYVNKAALEISGYAANDLIGSKILDFIHPDHKGLVIKQWLAWMRGENLQKRYELKIIINGGRWKWCDTSIATLEYGGKPAMLATMADITERKMAEEKALRSPEKSN